MSFKTLAAFFAVFCFVAVTTSNASAIIVCNERGCQASELARGASKSIGRHISTTEADERVVGHPSGCPRTAFCGCGTSVKVFGHPVRDLYRAAAWFKFRRASPAPGMVAVRNHHVFYIESVIDGDTVLAYDPNSGSHKTRVHTVSLRGYRVVDPGT